MKNGIKLLLAIFVLFAACDAVGLGGGDSDGGANGGGLVGTTWRGNYIEDTWADYGTIYYYTYTISFTSSANGRIAVVETDEVGAVTTGEYTFRYSVSSNRVTILLHDEEEGDATLMGDINGNVINMVIVGETVPFYKQ